MKKICRLYCIDTEISGFRNLFLLLLLKFQTLLVWRNGTDVWLGTRQGEGDVTFCAQTEAGRVNVVGGNAEEKTKEKKKNNGIVTAREMDSGYEYFPLDDLFYLYDYQVVEKHSSEEHSPWICENAPHVKKFSLF